MTLAGFPHSEICGSTLICSSPQLIAADRVLHRRMVPWHPPCALCSLIFSSLDPETNQNCLSAVSCLLGLRLSFHFVSVGSSLSCSGIHQSKLKFWFDRQRLQTHSSVFEVHDAFLEFRWFPVSFLLGIPFGSFLTPWASPTGLFQITLCAVVKIQVRTPARVLIGTNPFMTQDRCPRLKA